MEEKKKNNAETLEQVKKEYQKSCMTQEQVEQMKKRIEEAKAEKQKKAVNSYMGRKIAAAAAVVVAAFIVLPNTSENVAHAMNQIPVLGGLVEAVTFRDYKYDNGKHTADIETPKLSVKKSKTDQEDSKTQQNLKETTKEVNAEIQKLTDQIVTEFESGLKDKEGYQEMQVKHEVLSTTKDYFTLKLICYQAAGSGAETDYYYTIDLKTGKRLALADLFVEGADYITPISENIKQQMREQMKKDENVIYWLDDPEVSEWNFEKITDQTSFYLNQDGKLVICFNEGDVGPMSMGCGHHRLHDLSLHYRSFDGNYRLAGEYRSAFRDSINIAAEFEIGKIIEKFVRESLAAKIFDILGRELESLEIFTELLDARHDNISAAVGHFAEEHVEICDGVPHAVFEIAVCHRHFVEIDEHRQISSL